MSEQTAAPKRGPGPPTFEPTNQQRQTVQILRANGVPINVIAKNVHWTDEDQRSGIGIDAKTLRKYFKEQLDDGFEMVKAAMGASLVREGLKGNVGALRYWLATQGGEQWRQTERREIGFTPPADGQANTIPLLVLQPVLPAQVGPNAKPNWHAVQPTDAQLREPIADDED